MQAVVNMLDMQHDDPNDDGEPVTDSPTSILDIGSKYGISVKPTLTTTAISPPPARSIAPTILELALGGRTVATPSRTTTRLLLVASSDESACTPPPPMPKETISAEEVEHMWFPAATSDVASVQPSSPRESSLQAGMLCEEWHALYAAPVDPPRLDEPGETPVEYS